jgi:hypothetical protein
MIEPGEVASADCFESANGQRAGMAFTRFAGTTKVARRDAVGKARRKA